MGLTPSPRPACSPSQALSAHLTQLWHSPPVTHPAFCSCACLSPPIAAWVFDPSYTIPVPCAFPLAIARLLASTAGRREGCRALPEPAGRSQSAKAACSEQQYPQEGEQTAFSPLLFPVCSLPGFPSQPLSALAPARMLSISQGPSLGLDLLLKACKAGMSIL